MRATIGLIGAALAGGIGVALAAPAGLAVKAGLWEVTPSGDIQIPATAEISPDQLAKLPPKLQAVMQHMTINPAGLVPRRICVTQAMLQRATLSSGHERDCTWTASAGGPGAMEVRLSCTGHVSATGTIAVAAQNPENATGTADVTVTTKDGRSFPVHGTIRTHWLAADCGGVKPLQ